MSNHYKRYTETEKQLIKDFASSCTNKEDLYSKVDAFAQKLGRTSAAICRQVEEINNWFWAAKR